MILQQAWQNPSGRIYLSDYSKFPQIPHPAGRDETWRLDVNIPAILSLCFDPPSSACAFHLRYGRLPETRNLSAYSFEDHNYMCNCFYFNFEPTVKLKIEEQLKKLAETCTFFLMSLYCKIGESELDLDGDNHVVFVWYTRASVSEPWTATVLDPNYGSSGYYSISSEYDKELLSLHDRVFKRNGLDVIRLRHAFGLNVNFCLDEGICFSGLCMMLLLLPLSSEKFKNGAEAIDFALRAADALWNEKLAWNFIVSVHDNRYLTFVRDSLFPGLKVHPVSSLLSRAMSLVKRKKPVDPRDATKVVNLPKPSFKRKRSLSPQERLQQDLPRELSETTQGGPLRLPASRLPPPEKHKSFNADLYALSKKPQTVGRRNTVRWRFPAVPDPTSAQS